MELRNVHIAIIGCGNMGASLVEGLLHVGLPVAHLLAVETDARQRALMTERFGINAHADISDALGNVDLAVLAIKPQQAAPVLAQLAAVCGTAPVPLLSIMAGVRLARLTNVAGRQFRAVRAMPNLASRVRAGVTALYSTLPSDDPLCLLSESVMRSVGTALWIKSEELMDAVTAVSGCGPAYFFLLMELIERHALELGLDSQEARHLALQSAFGAAKLAIATDTSTAGLRRQVSSPGGVTEAAIAVLLEGGLDPLVATALKAAQRRAGELASLTE